MRCRNVMPLLAVSGLLVTWAGASQAEDLPLVSPLFGSDMVLQRDRKDPVWGWTTPGTEVTVALDGRKSTATAGADGKWMTTVGPGSAGGSHTLVITGPTSVTLSNIAFGDVWVCSGQSNMEIGIRNVKNAAEEIAKANYPGIRLFSVAKKTAGSSESIPVGRWDVCTPETVGAGGWGGFTGAGYFFGRKLHEDLKVPIGLIHTSWGGTVAEAWVSPEALSMMPDFKQAVTDARGRHDKETGNPNISTVLYNGMIAPLVPFAIKGAIWYQGESNAGRAAQYRQLLPILIKDWRARFQSGDFPFYIVQLANFQALATQPGEDAWAELREAQTMTAESVPNTGIAVTIDVGDDKDIHPKDKQTVGTRLALVAEAQTYHKRVAYAGPTFKSMKRQGSGLLLTFDHADGGIKATGGSVLGFALAGADHQFHWATGKIVGANSILVTSDDVPDPTAVRYGWAINPPVSIYNGAGLPAVPFRSDRPVPSEPK